MRFHGNLSLKIRLESGYFIKHLDITASTLNKVSLPTEAYKINRDLYQTDQQNISFGM